jgi:hypothetical protein
VLDDEEGNLQTAGEEHLGLVPKLHKVTQDIRQCLADDEDLGEGSSPAIGGGQ